MQLTHGQFWPCAQQLIAITSVNNQADLILVVRRFIGQLLSVLLCRMCRMVRRPLLRKKMVVIKYPER